MGFLYDIAQAHLDAYGVRAAALSRRMGTSPQTLDSWKNRGIRSLPTRELLEALARETRTPYMTVLHAALADAGYIDYLPKESDGDDRDAAAKTLPDLTPEAWEAHVADLRRQGVSDRVIFAQLGEKPGDPGHDAAGQGVTNGRRRRPA